MAGWIEVPLATNVLTLDNVTAFTPDADYEPATKKYVDDGIGGIPAESDPVFSASEAVNFVAGDKNKLDGLEAFAVAMAVALGG